MKIPKGELVTGNTWFRTSWPEFAKGFLGRFRVKFHYPETGYDENLEPVHAFVNHGNWLVRCPYCNGAEYAFEEGWFFCCSCKNSYIGHKYQRLVFPEERAEIEALLAYRPLLNRNWNPGETLEDLQRENEEHAGELLERGL